MKFFILISSISFLSLSLSSFGMPSISDNTSSVNKEIRLYRDAIGRPHIFAESNHDLFLGYGYAVAQDRLFQMEMLKRTAQGKVAEVLGKDYIAFDKSTREQLDPEAIKNQILRLKTAQSDVLQGYAEGMNLWIDKINTNHSKLLPYEFSKYQFMPSKWNAYDVAMILIGPLAMRFSDFNTEVENLVTLQTLISENGEKIGLQIFNSLMWQCDTDSVTTVKALDKNACVERNSLPNDLDVSSPVNITMNSYINESGKLIFSTDSKELWLANFSTTGLSGDITKSSASNIWLLAKNKLSDANGALLNGPQFGHTSPSYVYGVGLHGGDYDIVGNTLYASPNILFGHNNHISWGSTAGFADQVDIIQLKLTNNAKSYLYKDTTYDFIKRNEVLKVKDSQDIHFTIERSHLGSIEHIDKAAGNVYIRRRAWEGLEIQSMFGWLDIAKAKNWNEFQQGASKIAININLYYLDKSGNIGYTLGGLYPIRNEDQHPRLPMTDSTDWQGFKNFKTNPFEFQPTDNFIMNWNNRPHEKLASPDMWWTTWAKADRGNEIDALLSAQNKWSVEEVWDLNETLSFVDVNIRYLLPLLEESHRQEPFTNAAKEGLKLLQDWNKQWRDTTNDGFFDSPATTLMQQWLNGLLVTVLSDDLPEALFKRYSATGYPIKSISSSIKPQPGTVILIDSLNPIGSSTKYNFLNDETPHTIIQNSFKSAINKFTKLGVLTIPKSKVYPLKFPSFNYRGIIQGAREHQLPQIMNRGAENNLYVATGEGFKAWDVNPSGQSGFINSKYVQDVHNTDQLSLFENFEKTPILWSEKELQKNGFKMESIIK